MKIFKKLILTVSLIFSTTLILYGCNSSNNYTNKLEKIKTEGELILGTSADYPPYEFAIINEKGQEEIVGMDINIAQEIANDLGVNLIIKNMDFNGLLDALNSDSVDLVLSGMTPTSERTKNIDFSDIYYTSTNTILTTKENSDKLKTIEDLTDMTVGVQLGTIQANLANENLTNSKIKNLIKIPDLILELKSGKVDAVVMEMPVASQYIKTNDDLISIDSINLDPDSEKIGYAVAVKKGESELVTEINKTINKLVNENKIELFFNDAFNLSQNPKN